MKMCQGWTSSDDMPVSFIIYSRPAQALLNATRYSAAVELTSMHVLQRNNSNSGVLVKMRCYLTVSPPSQQL